MIIIHEYPPEQWDYIGTVIQTFSRNGLRNGWKIIEVEDDDKVHDHADGR